MLLHAKLLNLKTFIYAKSKAFKDIWKALIFFKDLNKNCDIMSLFSKTFNGLHIFKDFKAPHGSLMNSFPPKNNKFTFYCYCIDNIV